MEANKKKRASIQRQLAMDDGRDRDDDASDDGQPSYWNRTPSSRRRSRGASNIDNDKDSAAATPKRGRRSGKAPTSAASKGRRRTSRSPRRQAVMKEELDEEPDEIITVNDDDDDDDVVVDNSNKSDDKEDDGDTDNSDNDNSSGKPDNKPRRAANSRKQAESKEEEQEKDDDDDDDDESSSDFEATNGKHKTTPNKKKQRRDSTSKKGTGRGPESSRTCPHCDKVFTVKEGLEYHVSHFVCRPELRKEKGKKRKPKTEDSDTPLTSAKKRKGKKEYKRIRGAKADRTCPKCNRVFTSVHGAKYHIDHRVCELHATGASNRMEQHAFPVLSPGDEFVTLYGVVRVVRDDRATPTNDALPEDTAESYRRWKNTKARRDKKRKDHYQSVTVHSLARRMQLGQSYHGITAGTQQQPLWEAYFGGDPTQPKDASVPSRKFPTVAQTAELDPTTPHPLEPPASFPGRTVECILVRDARKVYDSIENDDDNGNDDPDHGKSADRELPLSQGGMRLFLRRKMLTERYNEDISRHRCFDCGKIYSSKDGYRFHVTTTRCTEAVEKKQQECQRTLVKIHQRAVKLVAYQKKRSVAARDPAISSTIQSSKPIPFNPVNQNRKQKDAKPKIERASMYPQVMVSLKFKVAPSSVIRGPRVSFFGTKKYRSRQSTTEQPMIQGCTTQALKVDNVDDPEILDNALDKLKRELAELQAQALGPVYPEVYKFLNFKNPSYLTTKKRPPEKKKGTKRRRRSNQPVPPEASSAALPPPLNLPELPVFSLPSMPLDLPIIDLRILAGEVDSGRFPSIKRNPGTATNSGHAEEGAESPVQHDDNCYLCKKTGGVLYPCDFCHRVTHLECLRSRFVVKDPEPHDDFMCNKCIQYIITMRRRAEKRRLEKLEKSKGTNEATLDVSADNAADDVDDEGVVREGREFEHLARQAQRVEELVGLLEDSKSRLDQYARFVNVNNFRRSHIIDL